MTDNIPQTSASERVEAARKALAIYDRATPTHPVSSADAHSLAKALRALIAPPAVGESEEQIAADATEKLWQVWDHTDFAEVQSVILGAVRAAIQSAHESWEPADVPSQEFMLRHLGIIHSQSAAFGALHIPEQLIDLEVI